MLQMIGELPITDDVDLSNIIEAQVAQQVLIETKRDVLSNGWDFNMDIGYSFPQDSTGYISVPANILDISDSNGDIILRDWKLYSKSNQSALFDEPQSMDVIWDLDFNSLSHPFRNYITIRAARIFAMRTVQDSTIASYTQADEDKAEINLRRSEGFTSKPNMLTGTYGQDNMVLV